MERYAITYRRPICKACKSAMMTHVVTENGWRCGCTCCKLEITPDEIQEIEREYWANAAIRPAELSEENGQGDKPRSGGSGGSEAGRAAS